MLCKILSCILACDNLACNDLVMLCEILSCILTCNNLAHDHIVTLCEKFVYLLNEMQIKDVASDSVEIIRNRLICEVTINVLYLLLLKLPLNNVMTMILYIDDALE